MAAQDRFARRRLSSIDGPMGAMRLAAAHRRITPD
jgi:hypothetical protein